jgi:hypothetical protein
MPKATEKRKTRKKVKGLSARPVSKEAAAQVKGGQTLTTSRSDPYKNFKFRTSF